MIKDIIDITKE